MRVAAGGFTGTPLQAPRLSSLTLGFSWPLPAVASLGCDIAVTRPPAAPDLAFQDTAPLETSKDFRPFGDRPRVGDALVVSSAAFARPAPGGTHAVTLRARRSALDPAALPDGTTAVELVWEYQTAAGWQLLGRSVSPPATEPPENARFGFHDGSAAFTLDAAPDGAPITFQAPADWTETVYGGQTGRWLRVRVSRGGYGSDARYQVVTTDGHTPATYPNTNIPVMQLVPASFRPPSLAALTAASSYRSAVQPFDHLLAENDFALAEPAPGGFAPLRAAGRPVARTLPRLRPAGGRDRVRQRRRGPVPRRGPAGLRRNGHRADRQPAQGGLELLGRWRLGPARRAGRDAGPHAPRRGELRRPARLRHPERLRPGRVLASRDPGRG